MTAVFFLLPVDRCPDIVPAARYRTQLFYGRHLLSSSLLAGNGCSYDTQTVLEMLFDIDTDNGINNDRIRDDSNRDSSCSDSCP